MSSRIFHRLDHDPQMIIYLLTGDWDINPAGYASFLTSTVSSLTNDTELSVAHKGLSFLEFSQHLLQILGNRAKDLTLQIS